MNDLQKESWHLNKSIPVSILVLILTQIVGFSVWITRLDSRVETNTNTIVTVATDVKKNEAQISQQRTQSNLQAVQLGRIEENLKAMKDILSGIDRKLQ